ncbi:type II secretory pathway protein [Vibrio cholerae O139]|nr:secretin N-terminal domain-containing protein [Vibrio cholerae]OWH58352.1 type II secretory pathway protein [Vibrio cholerae O139]OWH69280.1 type II secretory pathway protein [Vibrio cholerae O139]HAS4469087.1 type II secretory pathway protein [Vibrio cholerae]HCJ6817573.1 type II secretory pathway protein [Vibrio cholerae]HCJ6848192.1 type II secretory pathway protein [Vibrio cholerae]
MKLFTAKKSKNEKVVNPAPRWVIFRLFEKLHGVEPTSGHAAKQSTILKSARQLLLILMLSLPAHAAPFESSDTPIAEFASWYSQQTGIKVVLGQGVLGSVSFTAPDLVPAEYPAFFDSVLRAHGYYLVKDGNAYVIKIAPEAKEVITPAIVKLYRFNYIRNSKLSDLVQSTLKATSSEFVKDKQVDNYSVEILPNTNALIVSGTAQQLEKLDVLLSAIDVPQRQIFIEAVITETELGDNSELGVNLQAAFDKAGFVTNLVNASKLKDNLFIFESGDFNALVKAISGSSDTRLLSRPNILIMDRERGYITVGQNVPFLVSNSTTDGGTSVQRIERKDVGVSLEVTPHVMGDDVILVINQESSSVTDSTIAADIITNKRTLMTTVAVKSGQTIVLGGLISDEKRNVESGVPVLKDTPLIGGLFRSTSTKNVQKELRVVIKSTVL